MLVTFLLYTSNVHYRRIAQSCDRRLPTGISKTGAAVLRSLHAVGLYGIAVPSPGFPLAPEVLALARPHTKNISTN